MKKNLVFAVLCLINIVAAQAQKGLTLGVRGGATLVNISSPNGMLKGDGIYGTVDHSLPDYTFRPSFLAGLTVDYNLNNRWGLRLEPTFVRKGAKLKSVDYSQNTNLNYITAPVLAYYRVLPKLSVEAGAEFGFQLKEKSLVAADIYNTFDLGAVVGINWNLCKKWHIGTRYTHGIAPLTNIQFTDENGTDVKTFHQYNMVAEVYLRYDIYSFSKK